MSKKVKFLIIFACFILLGASFSCDKQIDEYTITLVTQGYLKETVIKHDGTEEILLPTPQILHYDFLGWCYNEDLSDEPIMKIEKGTTKDIVLYSKLHNNYINGIYNYGFDGKGLEFGIVVANKDEIDPYSNEYIGKDKVIKQACQKDIEESFNIKIKYYESTDSNLYELEQIKNIENKFNEGYYKENNIFAVNINSSMIATLAKSNIISELGDVSSETGYIYDYELDYLFPYEIIDNLSYDNKLYTCYNEEYLPEYFLYYNIDKISELGLVDPAEMWYQGKWRWSNFEQWVIDAQSKLDEGEYVIDCDYANFIIGASFSQGNRIINTYKKVVMFNKSSITFTFDKMKNFYNSGIWNKNSHDEKVSPLFINGNSLLHDGKLDYINNSSYFGSLHDEREFEIGVVPYPYDDYTTATAILNTYSITDNDDNIIKEATPLLKRDKTPLLDDSGNKIYGLDLNNSNYLMPYTSIDNCYAIINQDFDFNCGINPGIASAITSTLFNYCDGVKQTTDLENLDKLFTSELDKNIILTVSDNNFMFVEPIFSLSNNLSYDTNSTIYSWKEVCKIVTTTDIDKKEYLDNVRKEYEKYLTN